jgi:hypothetical protein
MRSNQEPSVAERAAAAAPYMLPVLDGFSYVVYIYSNVAPIGSLAYKVLPIVNAFESLPFAGLVLFIGLSFFTRNTNLSRFVRFNIQQALLLDIVLIIPSFFSAFTGIFPADLQAMGTNFWFYLWVLVVSYSWFNIAQGRTPDNVPILSEAASAQVGPF